MTTHAGDAKPMQLADLQQNIRHCWRCSHCKWVPSPQGYDFVQACPSIEYGGFHAYSGGGKVITAYALQAGEAGFTPAVKDSIYACSMCGACDTGCKSNNGELVEPLGILYALRAYAVEQGQAPPEHAAMVRNMRAHGNALGRPRGERSRWADGLDVPDATRQTVDILLHVGCENAYDEGQWAELRAIVSLLSRAGIAFGLLHDAESATGELAYDMGFQADAQALAADAARLIASTGAHTLITCSAGSYNGFINIWPRMGIGAPIEVRHVTDYIEALAQQGRLAVTGRFAETVTYHDPCKLGRLGEKFTPSNAQWTTILQTVSAYDGPTHTLFGNGGVYDPPRNLLARLDGISLVEMPRNRVAAYCCGAAGGGRQAVPEFAAAAARERLREAASTGAAIVATACGTCRAHLGEAAAGTGKMRVMGIFEILAEAMQAGAERVGA